VVELLVTGEPLNRSDYLYLSWHRFPVTAGWILGLFASSFPQLVRHVQIQGLARVAPLRREDFARMQCSTGPAFGHATRCFGHNSQTLDLFVESSAFQVVGFSTHPPVVQGLRSKSATMPDHSGMKLEGWIAAISLLLVLLLA
jgi:hypothetical protein